MAPENQRGGLDQLSGLVYAELKRIAAHHLRAQRDSHTLQPTALVHEVYLRLAHWEGIQFNDRAHFLALAGRLMRQILVEHARARNSFKRGGQLRKLTFDDAMSVPGEDPAIVIALDDALEDLGRTDARKSQIVEMRFFGGLSEAEIAAVLEVSVTTVGREMRLALAWLHRYVEDAEGSADQV